MNISFKFLILIALIGVASAAVYVTTNPEARLYFTRDSPGPDVLPVVSMIQTNSGTWTNSYGLGNMGGDILNVNMLHENGDATTFNGIVYFEIECAEGIVDNLDGVGIRDFETIVFTDPHNNSYSCNNNDCITRLSDNKIRIIPTTDTYGFEYGIHVYTNLTIEFLPYAYGDYILWVFVDEVG